MSRNKKIASKQFPTKQVPARSKSEEADDLPPLARASAPKGLLPEIASKVIPGTAPLHERLVTAIRRQSTTFNGPIPHPDIFRKYGEVVPDAPERILRVFEEDSKHSRELQMKALDAQRADNRRVHWMAWSLIAGGYAMSVAFAFMNKDVLAGIVLTTTIIGTVTGFLQSKKDIADDAMTSQSDDE